MKMAEWTICPPFAALHVQALLFLAPLSSIVPRFPFALCSSAPPPSLAPWLSTAPLHSLATQSSLIPLPSLAPSALARPLVLVRTSIIARPLAHVCSSAFNRRLALARPSALAHSSELGLSSALAHPSVLPGLRLSLVPVSRSPLGPHRSWSFLSLLSLLVDLFHCSPLCSSLSLGLRSLLCISRRGGDAGSPGLEATPHTSRVMIPAAWEYDLRSLQREALRPNSMVLRKDGAPPGPRIGSSPSSTRPAATANQPCGPTGIDLAQAPLGRYVREYSR